MPSVKTKDGKVKKFGYSDADIRAAQAYAKSTGGQLLAHKKSDRIKDQAKAKGYN
jgi:hypothetical protein|tara:strand:- start:2296 stop:2460 length:165 start_codon:yes stop_codon:yes gene_type:complete